MGKPRQPNGKNVDESTYDDRASAPSPAAQPPMAPTYPHNLTYPPVYGYPTMNATPNPYRWTKVDSEYGEYLPPLPSHYGPGGSNFSLPPFGCPKYGANYGASSGPTSGPLPPRAPMMYGFPNTPAMAWGPPPPRPPAPASPAPRVLPPYSRMVTLLKPKSKYPGGHLGCILDIAMWKRWDGVIQHVYRIKNVEFYGPARASGLRENDRILKVDGKWTVDMKIDDVVERLIESDEVRLVVVDGDWKDYTDFSGPAPVKSVVRMEQPTSTIPWRVDPGLPPNLEHLKDKYLALLKERMEKDEEFLPPTAPSDNLNHEDLTEESSEDDEDESEISETEFLPEDDAESDTFVPEDDPEEAEGFTEQLNVMSSEMSEPDSSDELQKTEKQLLAEYVAETERQRSVTHPPVTENVSLDPVEVLETSARAEADDLDEIKPRAAVEGIPLTSTAASEGEALPRALNIASLRQHINRLRQAVSKLKERQAEESDAASTGMSQKI